MPRVAPGAKTQAAARTVVESDKPIRQTMAENDQKAATARERARQKLADNADEAQQPSPVRVPASQARKADASDEFVFQSLDDSDDFLVLTMYGPAGTRKTTSICRMTMVRETGKLLVIAAESGLKKAALQKHGVDTSRVVFWPPRGTPITYPALEKLFYQLLRDLENDPTSWLGISWDSLTEIIQMLVDNAVQADIERMAEIARKAKKNLDVRAIYEREGADYQVATGQFRQLLRKYRTLPCHQVFVCLEEDRKESVDTEGGAKQKVGIIGPALTPAVRVDVEQHSDIILRVTVADLVGVGPVGVGRATPAEDMRAKDRYDVLPYQMIDPGFERVWAYVTGELKESTDGVQKVDASTAVEAPSETKARQEEQRAATRAARKTAAPKAPARRPSEKPIAESGTPDDPPM